MAEHKNRTEPREGAQPAFSAKSVISAPGEAGAVQPVKVRPG